MVLKPSIAVILESGPFCRKASKNEFFKPIQIPSIMEWPFGKTWIVSNVFKLCRLQFTIHHRSWRKWIMLFRVKVNFKKKLKFIVQFTVNQLIVTYIYKPILVTIYPCFRNTKRGCFKIKQNLFNRRGV